MVFKDFLLTDLLIRSLGHHSYRNVIVGFLLLVAHKFRALKNGGKNTERRESISLSFPLFKIRVNL